MTRFLLPQIVIKQTNTKVNSGANWFVLERQKSGTQFLCFSFCICTRLPFLQQDFFATWWRSLLISLDPNKNHRTCQWVLSSATLDNIEHVDQEAWELLKKLVLCSPCERLGILEDLPHFVCSKVLSAGKKNTKKITKRKHKNPQ
jgi:hypothetical protein